MFLTPTGKWIDGLLERDPAVALASEEGYEAIQRAPS